MFDVKDTSRSGRLAVENIDKGMEIVECDRHDTHINNGSTEAPGARLGGSNASFL